MEQINLNKHIFNKNQYEKVIDTNFSQLAITTDAPETQSISVSDFFNYYDQLFFEIPKLGETNSHEYLIKKSSGYVDSTLINNDIQALIDEINALQKQNLELNQQLIKIQVPDLK